MNWEVTTYSPWDYPEIPKGTPLISATFCGSEEVIKNIQKLIINSVNF